MAWLIIGSWQPFKDCASKSREPWLRMDSMTVQNARWDAARTQDITCNPTLQVPVLIWKVLWLFKHVQRPGFGLKRVPRTRVKVYLPLLSVHPIMVRAVEMTHHGRGLLSIPGFPITGKPGRIAETQQRGCTRYIHKINNETKWIWKSHKHFSSLAHKFNWCLRKAGRF